MAHELLARRSECWEGMEEYKRVVEGLQLAQQAELLLVVGNRSPSVVIPSLAELLVAAKEQSQCAMVLLMETRVERLVEG